MTTSSGSRSRRSSKTPRSAAETSRGVARPGLPRARGLAPRLARIAIVLVALVAAAALIEGDDRHEDAAPQRAAFKGPLDLDRPELLRFVKQGFRGRTDFGRRAVPLTEFVPAGPPRNGIPAIDRPKLVPVPEADRFLSPPEPVAVVEMGRRTRAYPLQILVWHEIVNDRIGGVPVAITYCPVCNSTVAFRRSIAGRTLDLRATGLLRNSDLVMYDRQTFTWWQQITGEAVVGRLTGRRLEPLPSQILSWRRFQALHPHGLVLSRETGFDRDYGRTPYVLYERANDPYLFRGAPDDALPATERVAAIATGPERAIVYPFSRLRREAPINDRIGDREIVVLFDPNVASALDDATIAEGERVGSAAVFARSVGGRMLSFVAGPRPGTVRDRETGSSWATTGRAVAGPLVGRRLRPVAHDDQFWFALAAFYPRAEIRR